MERVLFVSGPILYLKRNIRLHQIVVEAQKRAAVPDNNPGIERPYDPIRDL
jgi:hypothetical protein